MQLRGDLPGGRRELRIDVGPLRVAVTEIPARSLTDREWDEVLLARRSYSAMWGGVRSDIIAEDPVDGLDGDRYDTWHYLAWVSDAAGGSKLVTMRKVTLNPARLTERERAEPFDLLPVDIQFWKVETDAGPVPLWDVLKAHARRMAPDDPYAEFRIASTGRTGTYPFGEPQRTARERERTGIAFAAIQLLASYGDPSLLWSASLCDEFRDRVLGVVDVEGVYVPPDFTRSEDVLGLPAGSVGLDDRLDVVQEHRTAFPGYFIANDDAARVLARLLDEGRVVAAELRAAVMRQVAREPSACRDRRQVEGIGDLRTRADRRRLAALLTRSQMFKYLIPLIGPGRPLSALVAETGDGPFSATLVPARWRTSAWTILDVAQEKYAGAETDTVPVRLLPALRPWDGAAASGKQLQEVLAG
jgi:hypothetical protein